MRVSAIDIGTNTVLLLIADVESTGTLAIVRDEQVIARLGKGVDANRMILPETFERAQSHLINYKRMIDEAGSKTTLVCGTSFLRDAKNQQEFVEFIRQRVGLTIKVLSGDEEAALTYHGAISGIRAGRDEEQFAVLDIGGGSTELTLGVEQRIVSRTSIDVGSVRMTERFLKSSPPSLSGLNDAIHFMKGSLLRLPTISASTRLVGVAGTLTTLAALDLKLRHYDRTAVNGHLLKREIVEAIYDEMKTKTLEEIRSYPQILSERADIILAGILILREVLERAKKEEITVSDRGLRYGIALSAIQS